MGIGHCKSACLVFMKYCVLIVSRTTEKKNRDSRGRGMRKGRKAYQVMTDQCHAETRKVGGCF